MNEQFSRLKWSLLLNSHELTRRSSQHQICSLEEKTYSSTDFYTRDWPAPDKQTSSSWVLLFQSQSLLLWIQRYPSDGATNKQFPKQRLAGFWHRWYLFGWFLAILNSLIPIHITKSDWNMFAILIWMHMSSETNFHCFDKFGQINPHEKPAWFFWWIFLFPHRGPLCGGGSTLTVSLTVKYPFFFWQFP